LDNVIAFPSKSVRDRAEIERAIREVLLDGGASQEGVATVIANMGEFLDLLDLDFKFSFPASISASVEGQFKEFSVALQERTSRLIFERVKMEVSNLASSGIG
jgi:hypothetical protein